MSYSIWLNRRHGRVGPLFQGRYKSVPVEGGGWLYQLSQYVHLNPVRVRWLGLDKRGRRLEGLGLKGAASAEEAAKRLAVLREWVGYFHYRNCSKAMAEVKAQAEERLRIWLRNRHKVRSWMKAISAFLRHASMPNKACIKYP